MDSPKFAEVSLGKVTSYTGATIEAQKWYRETEMEKWEKGGRARDRKISILLCIKVALFQEFKQSLGCCTDVKQMNKI